MREWKKYQETLHLQKKKIENALDLRDIKEKNKKTSSIWFKLFYW